jgi:hypothetical protein
MPPASCRKSNPVTGLSEEEAAGGTAATGSTTDWGAIPRRPICVSFANQPRKVVLDFAGLERLGYQPVISSAMNDALVGAKRLADTFDCQWRVCGLTKYTRTAYDISALRLIFPQVHDAESEAIAAFSQTITSDALQRALGILPLLDRSAQLRANLP